MDIFLIGGGYVGRGVLQRLLAQGHRVTALARTAAAADRMRALGAVTTRGDLTRPQGFLADANRAEVVIDTSHLRALGPDAATVGPAAYAELLEGLSGQRFILTTGGGILGATGPQPADETRPVQTPTWRSALEQAVLAAPNARGAVIRPSLVYGHGASIVIEEAIEVARRLGAGWHVGDGGARWSAVCRDDLADLYLAVARSDARQIVHASSQVVVMTDFARALADGQGLADVIAVAPDEAAALSPFAPSMGQDSVLDSAKARSLFGWSPSGPSLLDELRAGSYRSPSPAMDPR